VAANAVGAPRRGGGQARFVAHRVDEPGRAGDDGGTEASPSGVAREARVAAGCDVCS